MKDDDDLPTTTSAAAKKDVADLVKVRYKFWALTAILLLASWSMFTGTVTLRRSAGNLGRFSDELDPPIHDDLDVLEMEEREKVVEHMWDVYTNSRRIRLPRFWQEAFEAAYEDLSSDVPSVRENAVSEITIMSVRSVNMDPPPFQSAGKMEGSGFRTCFYQGRAHMSLQKHSSIRIKVGSSYPQRSMLGDMRPVQLNLLHPEITTAYLLPGV